jgi:hypothetical protein
VIVDRLIDVLRGGYEVLVNLLPEGDTLGLVLPSGWLYGYDVLNSFLPVAEVLAAASVLLALRMAVFTFRMIYTLKQLVPLAG